MRWPIMEGLLFALVLCWGSLSGQNVAMHFDGNNDWISLNPINNHAPGGDFTVEMWFQSTATSITGGNCSGNFKRMFSVGAPVDRFEVGECDGILTAYLDIGGTGPGLFQSGTNVRDGQWHCISAVRSGPSIDIYYDGAAVPGLTGLAAGIFSGNRFTVGHWSGGLTPGQDWQGYIDEVKFWDKALAQIKLTACSPCVLPCNEPDLIAYWHFDEGIPNGNNTGLNSVKDCTPNGNNGNIFLGPSAPPPFTLNGTVSNFVPSTAPMLYPEYSNLHIKLTDPTQAGISIVGICEGEPLHFAIVNGAGVPVPASGLASVQWEYSDDCFSGSTPPVLIPGTGPPSALFSGFSFVSTPGHPVLNCAGLNNTPAPNGFVDRCYRAIITVSNGISTCTYTAQPAMLQICCKLPAINLTVTPPGPLCENDVVTFQASLSSNPTLPTPGPGNFYNINWCVTVNGVPTNLTGTAYDDQPSISYGPVTLVPGTYCIKATVSNCLCPPVTVQYCFRVDPKPICGTIKMVLPNAAIMSDPDSDPNHFLICPGNTAALMIDLPFTNCIPHWEFMFPSVGTWLPLGSSNGMQNTNILPQTKPVSPYLWPAGETCIMYRIKCLPLSWPNSGCPPCYSNEIRICLKRPAPAPIISASPMQICKGTGSSTLSVQNSNSNCTYQWFCNGLAVGAGGPTLISGNGGCYRVTCYDGCFTTTSNKVCVDVCEVVAIISCPTPNCPKVGDPVTLNALSSYSTCGHPLSYVWTWTDANGNQSSTSSSITVIPDACGTVYTLKVTDTVLGCMDVTQTKIEPCTP